MLKNRLWDKYMMRLRWQCNAVAVQQSICQGCCVVKRGIVISVCEAMHHVHVAQCFTQKYRQSILLVYPVCNSKL